MRNILIMGIGRAGKTTLSKMIKNKYPDYNLIHSDALKWGMIRADDKEQYYRENVLKQKEFEHSEFFQRTLLGFFKSSINKCEREHGYILESGQLHPQIVKEMINFENTVVICLGLGELTAEEITAQVIKHDTQDSWTYGLPKEYILKHAEDWERCNKMLKQECPKYGIEYIDTSKNRDEVLKKILSSL